MSLSNWRLAAMLALDFAERFERGNGQRRDDAQNRNDGQQFDQREPRLATQNFHNFTTFKKLYFQLKTLSLLTPTLAGDWLSIFPSGPADQTMTLP